MVCDIFPFFLNFYNFKCPVAHRIFSYQKKGVNYLKQSKGTLITHFKGMKYGNIFRARMFFAKVNFGEKYSLQYTMLQLELVSTNS